MECVSPPELDDGRLWSYMDSEADQETIHHLEHCEHCREKAKVLAQLQKRVKSRLYRITCPSSLELGEYHLRMLPASQMLVVAQHVRECSHCAREVSQLEGFLSDLALTREDSLLGRAKVLIARLVGDDRGDGVLDRSALAPATAPLRGDRKGPITLEADGIVITLDIQPAPGGNVSILGQVAADDQDHWTGAVVELRQADAPQLTASLDDLGAFHFKEARPGSTQITITSPYGIIVQIPNFDIAV